ncbi:Fe(2+) transport protein A/Fe(2+) transporter FeoB fusion protein [uncultured Gammaproteobacteria bacterium]
MSRRSLPITTALAGNPNCGKTSLFNRLTGAFGIAANYPRVTVTRQVAETTHDGRTLRVIDLPGIYTLNGGLPEERVGRDVIHFERPDVVVNVLDAGNLHRSLFLTIQLVEMGRPCVFVLNMIDEARGQGITIDRVALAAALGGPVVETVAVSGDGVPDVLHAVVAVSQHQVNHSAPAIRYQEPLEGAIGRVQTLLAELRPASMTPEQSRWLAIKLLEGDTEILQREGEHDRLIALIGEIGERIERDHGEDCAHMIAHARFGFIDTLLRRVVQRTTPTPSLGHRLTHRLDDLLLHRWLGLPALGALMWLMFQATFTLGALPTVWINAAVAVVTGWADQAIPPGLTHDLIVNGVLAGVGGTIVFLPNIMILFFFMAVFSETGYLARAAFLLDRVMRAFGLHGKAMIPLIMGFGCNATAIMATRTIETKRSRLIAILAAPYVSCSARLPVFILFGGAFFDRWAGSVVFALYALSVLVALGAAVAFDRVLLVADAESFLMELPPYRRPALHSLAYQVWDSVQDFLRKIGGIIVIGSVAIWFLQQYPAAPETATAQEAMAASYLGKIADTVNPVFAPLGFGHNDTIAILTGLMAKETVVSTYAVLHAQEKGSEGLRQAIARGMTQPIALAFMVFVLLYTPCLTTLAVIGRESGSWRWAGLSLVCSLVVAWTLAYATGAIAETLGKLIL